MNERTAYLLKEINERVQRLRRLQKLKGYRPSYRHHEYDKYDGPMCDRCLETPRFVRSEREFETRLSSAGDAELCIFKVEDYAKEPPAWHCRECRLLEKGLRYKECPRVVSYAYYDPGNRHIRYKILYSYYGDGDIKDWESVLNLPLSDPFKSTCLSEGVDFEVIKSWIADCKGSHDKCNSKPELRKPLLDLKVIDCIERVIVPAPNECQFVALSYVWGPSEPGIATLSGQLPQTIEDSIQVSSLLGYRYLWVDRFCVDQSSRDKHVQVQQMGAIYASAEITLVAAAGKDSDYGLPGVSRKPMHEDTDLGKPMVCQRPSLTSAMNSSTWAKRGWTFQEGYMSRRRLCFTEQRIGLFCDTAVYPALEGFEERPSYFGDGTNPLPITYRHPQSIALIESYTSRTLKYDSDALDAIVGILNVVWEKGAPLAHIWGVPFWQDSPLALYWSHICPVSRRPGFPSWSPLGWRGGVVFDDEASSEDDPQQVTVPDRVRRVPFRLGSCDIRAWMGNDFEPLPQPMIDTCDPETFLTPESQRLQITALISQHKWTMLGPQSDSVKAPPEKWHLVFPSDEISDLCIPVFFDDKDFDPTQDSSTVCAFLPAGREGNLLGLLLKSHDGFYERVGRLELGNPVLVPKCMSSGDEKIIVHSNESHGLKRLNIDGVEIDWYQWDQRYDDYGWYEGDDWYKNAELKTFLLG